MRVSARERSRPASRPRPERPWARRASTTATVTCGEHEGDGARHNQEDHRHGEQPGHGRRRQDGLGHERGAHLQRRRQEGPAAPRQADARRLGRRGRELRRRVAQAVHPLRRRGEARGPRHDLRPDEARGRCHQAPRGAAPSPRAVAAGPASATPASSWPPPTPAPLPPRCSRRRSRSRSTQRGGSCAWTARQPPRHVRTRGTHVGGAPRAVAM
mmetsp:Transcript_31911/g.78277  ORF Transcript_31911/g.78277 Transcript_31911/m.78277 type:complete len:214 (+) Transcript_31911:903-1544(+)